MTLGVPSDDPGASDPHAILRRFVRRRRTDIGVLALIAAGFAGFAYWRIGPGLATHVLAGLTVVFFAWVGVSLVVRDRKERAAFGTVPEAQRAFLRDRLTRHVDSLRRLKGVWMLQKVAGLGVLALCVASVVKEQWLGNGWAGLPQLAYGLFGALVFTVWPLWQERVRLPRLERDLAAVGS